MNRTAITVGLLAVVGAGFAVAASGSAQAVPQDCMITRDVVGASAHCADSDAPPGREYALVIDCWGLHGVPNAFPLMAIDAYAGEWSGSFSPTDGGSASCLGPLSVGVLTDARVVIYRE